MITFTIDNENNITTHASVAEAKGLLQAESFSSGKELSRLASKWPATRLADIWNTLPGQKPVKKFTDRKKAVARIWAAIQPLVAAAGAQAAPVATKKARSSKRATKNVGAPTARAGSKAAQILALLKRPGGATLKNIMAVSEWQAHSVRGFISGTLGKKMGLTIASTKDENNDRTYSIEA